MKAQPHPYASLSRVRRSSKSTVLSILNVHFKCTVCLIIKAKSQRIIQLKLTFPETKVNQRLQTICISKVCVCHRNTLKEICKNITKLVGDK